VRPESRNLRQCRPDVRSENGDAIKVKEEKGKVNMPTIALSLTGTAMGSKTGNAALLIIRQDVAQHENVRHAWRVRINR